MPEPAYDGDGTSAQLALREIRGCRYLVGDGHHRDLQFVPVRVPYADVVIHGAHSRDADGMVGLAEPPRPSSRIRDDHSQAESGRRGQPLSEQHRASVRVAGQEQDRFGSEVGVVDTRSSDRQASSGADNPGLSPAGNSPGALRRNELGTSGGRFDTALGLADDLGRDNEDVSVAQRSGGIGVNRCEQDQGKISTRRHLPDPSWCEDRDHEVADLIA